MANRPWRARLSCWKFRVRFAAQICPRQGWSVANAADGQYFNWKGLLQVYLLENTVNGKYYVGKTVSHSLNSYLSVKRWAARHGKAQNMPVVRAMQKYGISAFRATVLVTADSAESLSELERLWIIVLDARNPHIGYNISAGGGGARRPCSLETRLKIGRANKGRKPVGYARTAEHSQQVRERMKGNKHGKGRGLGHAVSAEEREKHRQNAIKQWDEGKFGRQRAKQEGM